MKVKLACKQRYGMINERQNEAEIRWYTSDERHAESDTYSRECQTHALSEKHEMKQAVTEDQA